MQIPCEQIVHKNYVDKIFVSRNVSINACVITETSISTVRMFLKTPPVDVSDIKILFMHSNRKMAHLPINVYKTFPELTDYYASKSSLTKISYPNFRGLILLEVLLLDKNSIEKIAKDTFQDLTSLYLLKLSKLF